MIRCGCGCMLAQVDRSSFWAVVAQCSLHFYHPLARPTGGF